MKNLIILFLLFFTAASAKADNSNALFIAGVIGGAVNTGYQSHLGQLPEELSDWADPATQSTSRLEAQCGILSETKVLRTGRFNLLFLGIRNEGKSDVLIQLDRIRTKFSNGRERIALANGPRSIEVKKNWYSWGFVLLPNKSDFKDQTEMQINIPVGIDNEKPCEISTTIKRNTNLPEDENTYREAPNFLISFGLGLVTSQSGKFQDIMNAGSSMDLYMGGFSEPKSGWYLLLSAGNSSLKDSNYFGSSVYTNAREGDLSIGKTWRQFHSDKTTGFLSLGPSYVTIQADNGFNATSKVTSESKSGYGVYAAYTLDYRYAREYFGYFRGDYSAGITFFAKYYPSFNSESSGAGLYGISFELFRIGN